MADTRPVRQSLLVRAQTLPSDELVADQIRLFWQFAKVGVPYPPGRKFVVIEGGQS